MPLDELIHRFDRAAEGLADRVRKVAGADRIFYTASALGDRVELRVVDRGPGIPEEDRDRMFVPFQRLGDTDNTTGVGLGLALSRGLTEAMGGTLTADDTPGGGLTMTVSVPVAATEPGYDCEPGHRERAGDAATAGGETQ